MQYLTKQLSSDEQKQKNLIQYFSADHENIIVNRDVLKTLSSILVEGKNEQTQAIKVNGIRNAYLSLKNSFLSLKIELSEYSVTWI